MSDVLSVKAFPEQSSAMKVSSRTGRWGLADVCGEGACEGHALLFLRR